MKTTLAQRMTEGGYDGYAYAYPHKTAYRPLDPPIPLEQVWQDENRQHLFLYVHLPFCEMRCGFCNLFTTAQPTADLVTRTLDSLHRQSAIVAEAVQPQDIVQAAFGGGTPSFLGEAEIERVFLQLAETWPMRWREIPVSFEVSPGTITRDKLALLKSLGVDRISLGVQSFVPEDLLSLKRPQPAAELEDACQLIKMAGFPVFNMDLIYGNEGQTARRWQRSLDCALEWQPEELYLYPLYVRKLTNLDRVGMRPGDLRRDLYRQARDYLLESGYRQISMRLFRRQDVCRSTDYCCQDDGMIGLGSGARSYTRALHYSTEYAVGQAGVRRIIEAFNSRDASCHRFADHGIHLDLPEQQRRYVIKSLLRLEGVCHAAYRERFGRSVLEDLPQLRELLESGLANDSADALRLTAEGLSWSDTIGPWLYSDITVSRMNACVLV
jgi:oxygen-independent coproporphyrinogen-3 oxidase